MVKEDDGVKQDEQAKFIDSKSVFPQKIETTKAFDISMQKGQKITCSRICGILFLSLD